MVLITEGASTELRRLLSYHAALPRQGMRLRVDELGSLKMAIDAPHLGDAVIRRDKVVLVIMDPPVSARLAGRVLDFCSSDGQPRPEFRLRDKPADP